MSCSVRCAHCRICFCNKGEECWFSHGGPASKHPPPPADYQWQHSSPLLQGISDGLIHISPYFAQSCMYQQWSANLHFPYDQVCNAVCFCFCSCFCFCFCVCFLSASASAATISVSECFCCNDMICRQCNTLFVWLLLLGETIGELDRQHLNPLTHPNLRFQGVWYRDSDCISQETEIGALSMRVSSWITCLCRQLLRH